MKDERNNHSFKDEAEFVRKVEAMTIRKLRSLQNGQSVWSGLGMSGLIGWSVAIPTVAGGMIGLWWDNRHPGNHSWTLILLAIGLCIGCANAWHWVDQENKAMQNEREDKHE